MSAYSDSEADAADKICYLTLVDALGVPCDAGSAVKCIKYICHC